METDIPGNDIVEIHGTTDDAACLEMCMAHPGCNAATRHAIDARCWLKTVDPKDFPTKKGRIFNSWVLNDECGMKSTYQSMVLNKNIIYLCMKGMNVF